MRAYINGISYYLPIEILDNEKLSQIHPEWSVEKISQKTGIYQRHVSAGNEFSSDMALTVIEKLFDEYQVPKSKIDFLLFCTQSPDYLLPTTACILQNKAGLPKTCGALDFNLGCSGFIYGLGLAKGLVETGQVKNVLLVTAETYTKLIHPKDKSNKTLFGDGAAATLITSEPESSCFHASISNLSYGTDGSGYESLIVRNSGIRHNCVKHEDLIDEEGNFVSNDDYLYMNGKEIFNFTAFEIPPLINRVLKENSLSLEDVDMFIFHQANEYMLDFVRKRCKIPQEKFFISLSDGGNTVSSTIPIAMRRAIDDNRLQKGDKVLLAGFGVGLSMGAVVVEVE
ncbi:MAG: ketoacyl-ACP synthase III [Bacteroidia bacterium]|nr:ketoacyl-ACP synthase III [Bacteroidia bacterium]